MHRLVSKGIQRWLAGNRSAIVLFGGIGRLSKILGLGVPGSDEGFRWFGKVRGLKVIEGDMMSGGEGMGRLSGISGLGVPGSDEGFRWFGKVRSLQGFRGFGGPRSHQVYRKIRRHEGFRRFRRSSLYTWIALHLLLIILVNSISAYKAYHDFYHTPATAVVVQKLTPLVEARAIRYYGRYTGAETGYGFFGINVRSNGILIGECGGTPMTADFKSYETNLRFFSMANALTDDFIRPDAHDSLPGGLLGEYNNLVFKNIAVTLYQQHGCVDSTVLLSYNVLQFPTLQAVRTGTPPLYQLTKLVTGSYSLTPHAQ